METIEGGGNHNVRCREPRWNEGTRKSPPYELTAEVDTDVGLDHQPRDQQAGDGGHHHRHLHILARLEWAHPIGSVHSAFRERPERVSSLFH